MDTVGSLGVDGVSIRIEPPEEWFVKESYTLIAPDGQANLILSSEPLDLTITMEEYAAVQGDLLSREFPEFVELAFEDIALQGGITAKLRIFEWMPPDGIAVMQAQIYYVGVAGRGVTATATTPRHRFLEIREVLLRALSSISITAPSPDAPEH